MVAAAGGDDRRMTMNTDNPFAFWTVFHGIHHWFLADGCPPTVGSDRFWMRALRVTVLLGSLGVISGCLSSLIARLPTPVLYSIPLGSTGSSVVINVAIPLIGLLYGALVLLPLLRWSGQSWVIAGLSLPVSSVAFLIAVWTAAHLVYLSWPSALGGAVGAGTVGVLMTPWRRPAFWWLLPASVLVGACAGFAYGKLLLAFTRPFPAGWLELLASYGSTAAAYSLFQASLAVTLGVRLWFPVPKPPSSRGPRQDDSTHTSRRPAASVA
jgi:hypothetical protein